MSPLIIHRTNTIPKVIMRNHVNDLYNYKAKKWIAIIFTASITVVNYINIRFKTTSLGFFLQTKLSPQSI